MYEKLGIKESVATLVNECEKDCLEEFKKIDDLEDITISLSHCKEYGVANVVAIYNK